MASPIYQLFIIQNNVAANLARKARSEAEEKSLWAQEKASRESAGAKGILVCDSAWADEEHPAWGILSFPGLAARIQHTHNLQEMGWLDTMDAFTLLGTLEGEPQEIKIPDPIFALWVIKNNPAAAQMEGSLSKGLDAFKWEKHNALYKEYQSQVMLYCDSSWCNEAYQGFGVSAYPNIEARMQIMKGLNELGWPRYLDVFSLLGTKLD